MIRQAIPTSDAYGTWPQLKDEKHESDTGRRHDEHGGLHEFPVIHGTPLYIPWEILQAGGAE